MFYCHSKYLVGKIFRICMLDQNTNSYMKKLYRGINSGNIIFYTKDKKFRCLPIICTDTTHGRNILRFNTNIGAKV